jgi:type II secretory pathway predicted ATPase ExeA
VRYGLRPKRSASQTAQAILDELARSDRNEILILDEAHRLPAATLDELRLLSNLDFDRVPPFALILAGQLPLRETLAQPELASLHQRLSIRTSLTPLSEPETTDYLDRRLRASGARATLFRPQAAARIFEKTRGVLRLINNLALASLLAAATTGKKHVDLQEIDDAAFDQENS